MRAAADDHDVVARPSAPARVRHIRRLRKMSSTARLLGPARSRSRRRAPTGGAAEMRAGVGHRLHMYAPSAAPNRSRKRSSPSRSDHRRACAPPSRAGSRAPAVTCGRRSSAREAGERLARERPDERRRRDSQVASTTLTVPTRRRRLLRRSRSPGERRRLAHDERAAGGQRQPPARRRRASPCRARASRRRPPRRRSREVVGPTAARACRGGRASAQPDGLAARLALALGRRVADRDVPAVADLEAGAGGRARALHRRCARPASGEPSATAASGARNSSAHERSTSPSGS